MKHCLTLKVKILEILWYQWNIMESEWYHNHLIIIFVPSFMWIFLFANNIYSIFPCRYSTNHSLLEGHQTPMSQQYQGVSVLFESSALAVVPVIREGGVWGWWWGCNSLKHKIKPLCHVIAVLEVASLPPVLQNIKILMCLFYTLILSFSRNAFFL